MYHHGYVATFGVNEFIDLEMAAMLLLVLMAMGLGVFALAVEVLKKPLKKFRKRLSW